MIDQSRLCYNNGTLDLSESVDHWLDGQGHVPSMCAQRECLRSVDSTDTDQSIQSFADIRIKIGGYGNTLLKLRLYVDLCSRRQLIKLSESR